MSDETKDFLSSWPASDAPTESDTPPDAPAEPHEAPPAETPESKSDPVNAEPTEQTVDKSAPTAEAKDTHVPLAALMAEREKRQAHERELQALKDQLAQLNKQPEKQFWEDPEGIVKSEIAKVKQELPQRQHAVFEMQAKSTHSDYDEVLNYFAESAKTDPMLQMEIRRLMDQDNPAEAAYQFGKRLKVMRDMGDPVKYEQDIETRLRAKIASEQEQAKLQDKRVRDAIPPDLTATRSTKDDGDFAVEDVFDSIFKKDT